MTAAGQATTRWAVPARVSRERLLGRLRATTYRFPGVREEAVGAAIRWRVRGQIFAHFVAIENGWPPAFAAASGLQGPVAVLAFRVGPHSRRPERFDQAPYFKIPWAPDLVGVNLDAVMDWDDVAEGIEDSYRLQAPRSRTSAAALLR